MTTNVLETIGATKKWKSSGGDGVITLTSVGNAAGRQGDRLDLGAILASGPNARATWFRWYMKLKAQASGLAVGNTLDIYHGYSNDDVTPGDVSSGHPGSSDAAFATAAFLNNLRYAGSVIVDDTTGGTLMSRDGLVYIPYRYVTPVFWNATGATLSATATDFEYWLTPVNPQTQ